MAGPTNGRMREVLTIVQFFAARPDARRAEHTSVPGGAPETVLYEPPPRATPRTGFEGAEPLDRGASSAEPKRSEELGARRGAGGDTSPPP